jgi:hypothetical protein
MSGMSSDPELSALMAEFGVEQMEGSMGSQAQQILSAIDADLRASGIQPQGAMELQSMLSQATPEVNAFIFDWLRKKAAEAIARLRAWLERNGHCVVSCGPHLAEAVREFGRKNYAKALWACAQGVACIARCAK